MNYSEEFKYYTKNDRISGTKLSVFANNMIFCVENPKNSMHTQKIQTVRTNKQIQQSNRLQS